MSIYPLLYRSLAFFLLCVIVIPSAVAQSVTGSVTPDDPYDVVDENGVNVITGVLSITSEDLEIGGIEAGSGPCLSVGGWKKEQSKECAPQEYAINSNSDEKNSKSDEKNTKSDIESENGPKLGLKRFWTSGSSWQGGNLIFGWSTNWSSNISLDKGKITATLGNQSYYFASATMNSTRGDGATIQHLGSLSYKITTKDGTEITFLPSWGPASKIVYPNSRTVNISYASRQGCGNSSCNDYKYYRVQQVTSSDGYALQFEYEDDNSIANNISAWMHASKVTAFQSGMESCPPSSIHCNFSQPWPSAEYTRATPANLKMTSKLPSGRTLEYTMVNGNARISKIVDPDANITHEYNYFSGAIPQQGMVSSVARAGNTWQYSPNVSLTFPFLMTLDVTAPDGGVKRYIGDRRFGLYEIRDALGRSTKFTYDTKGRLLTVIRPEGNGISLVYDDRGNILSSNQIPKSGSGLMNLTTTAVYSQTCPNVKTCNQPISVTDPRGATTNYTFDATHGGMLTELAPADERGVRPETRHTYTFLNGSYRISKISKCILNSNCFGSPDEYFTIFSYLGPTALNSQTTFGTSSATISNSAIYDSRGNIIQKIDGMGVAQHNLFDLDRRLIGKISADPDGTASLPRIGLRYTYNGSGKVKFTESGVVTGTQLSDLTGMLPTKVVENRYDTLGRITSTHEASSGVVRRINQFSYDGSGRLECSTERMIESSWSSLPANACALVQAGANDDADRITRNVYDAAGQLVKVQKAYGTGIQQDYATYTYTLNGKQAAIKDANGNLASLVYDGYDRMKRWVFPSKTVVGAVDASNYEEYDYDANGNRTSLRKRDGSVFTYQYDALNRNTVKFVPERAGLSPTHTRDVYYGYDLRGLQISARFDNINGEGVLTSYDGFGRRANSQLTLDGAVRDLSYAHDANGNRINLTHPDGINFGSTYDTLDRTTGIYVNSNGVHVNYSYRSDGKLESIGRLGGSNSTYVYDGVQRLQSLSNNFVNIAFNVIDTFQFNPARQIKERTTSNDVYAWAGAVNVNRNYSVNGLNQYVSAGPASFTYDLNGNLTGDGSSAYVYDVENRLVQKIGPNNAALRYDPLGRLYETSAGTLASTTRFHYDGDELIGEYVNNGSGWVLSRRYIHGEIVDDPMIWFEGGGVASPHFLHTNYQGSIVAVANNSGAALTVNSYDEWGIPATGNQGRFQYTGQTWIPELGMYYYKARIYSPTLGRFMQTDPIGYDDDINLYAYVDNDPVNKTDPTGTQDSLDRAISRDEQAVLNGKMTRKEFRERQQARGGGAVAAAGVVAVAVAAPTVGTAVITAARTPKVRNTVIVIIMRVLAKLTGATDGKPPNPPMPAPITRPAPKPPTNRKPPGTF